MVESVESMMMREIYPEPQCVLCAAARGFFFGLWLFWSKSKQSGLYDCLQGEILKNSPCDFSSLT